MLIENRVTYDHFGTAIFEDFEGHWHTQAGFKGPIGMHLTNGILTGTIRKLQSIAVPIIYQETILVGKTRQSSISDDL